jgi:hypothetical protein
MQGGGTGLQRPMGDPRAKARAGEIPLPSDSMLEAVCGLGVNRVAGLIYSLCYWATKSLLALWEQ